MSEVQIPNDPCIGQEELWEDDKLRLEVGFSMYVGWEWSLYERIRGEWRLAASGTANSTASAMVQAADELVDRAQTRH